MATIAFIGLGNMGGPMATNLLNAGHDVTVFDLSADAVTKLQAQGAKSASSASDAAQSKDVVVSMLPAGKHVESVYLAEGGILSVVSSDTLLIDSSTIDAATAKKVALACADKGVQFIDAPVSGGVGGAQAGTLTFIVGGESEAFAKAQPILAAMGKNIFHAGAHGAGQVAKICNNMLLSILMCGTAEALQLGVDHGLDPKVLSDIMLQSSGRNWTLELYNPCPDVMENVPSSNGYQGGFMVDLMAKDLGLAMDAALGSQSSTPMGTLARSLYAMHSLQGNGKLDFSSIFQMYQREENN